MSRILELKKITKKFGPVTVFKDVDLNLDEGEIIALVGENGAGKSTLMNVLNGVYPAGTFEGEIIMNGEKKNFQGTKDAKDAGIELIHQEISLHLDLSVAENIFLGNLENSGGFLHWKSIFEKAQPYLDQVGLSVSPTEPVRDLGTSQQQLLSIAKALACKPKVILFDEPTSALTEADAKNLLDIIKGLKQQGISSIYISHRLEEVMNVADRVVVLRDGRLISDRPRAECRMEQIIEDMVGRKLDEMYPKKEVPIGEEVLRVEDLSVDHPYILHKNIVEHINFNVHKGEILGFFGLVGSGRSETMNAIYGSLKKTNGKIFLSGKEIRTNRPLQAIQQGIGLVTEDRKQSGIVDCMNLRENMTLASLPEISRNGFINKNKETSVSQEYFGKLKVKADSLEQNIMDLSGGNQQKIILSRWLMKDIRVLILDEPTHGVDVGAKVEIYNIMTQLAQRGVAIIMVSSELPELIGMCDRLLVLGRGRIRGEFNRKEVTQEKVMRAATCVEEFSL